MKLIKKHNICHVVGSYLILPDLVKRVDLCRSGLTQIRIYNNFKLSTFTSVLKLKDKENTCQIIIIKTFILKTIKKNYNTQSWINNNNCERYNKCLYTRLYTWSNVKRIYAYLDLLLQSQTHIHIWELPPQQYNGNRL